MPAANFQILRICDECGATFMAKTVESRYCCKACTNRAYAKRRKEKLKAEQLEKVVAAIPDSREYITIAEAVAIFGISRETIRRLIHKGEIKAVNLGVRLIRIDRRSMEEKFPVKGAKVAKNVSLPKKYSLEPKDCYTVGEISEKYKLSESTVYKNIREHAIPIRQIGKFVYVPKSEIDTLFKKGSMV